MASLKESVNEYSKFKKATKGKTPRQIEKIKVKFEENRLKKLTQKQKNAALNNRVKSLKHRLKQLPNFKPKTLNNMFNNNNVSKGYENPILEADDFHGGHWNFCGDCV